MIIVISGPSGVGKGTVVQKLMEKNPRFVRSISCTTRKSREGEKNGRDYHFINEDKFFELLQKNELAEFASVHGCYYGTPFKNLTEEKTDVILQIDVQGAKKIKIRFPEALLIFLLPPSMEILTNRLNRRGTETEEEQEMRLKRAEEEIEERTFYDYIIVNDDIEKVTNKIEKIIEKERKLRQQNKAISSQ